MFNDAGSSNSNLWVRIVLPSDYPIQRSGRQSSYTPRLKHYTLPSPRPDPAGLCNAAVDAALNNLLSRLAYVAKVG